MPDPGPGPDLDPAACGHRGEWPGHISYSYLLYTARTSTHLNLSILTDIFGYNIKGMFWKANHGDERDPL